MILVMEGDKQVAGIPVKIVKSTMSKIQSKQDDVEIFYFTSFDESWKVGAEGDVGAYWGLWDMNQNLKF